MLDVNGPVSYTDAGTALPTTTIRTQIRVRLVERMPVLARCQLYASLCAMSDTVFLVVRVRSVLQIIQTVVRRISVVVAYLQCRWTDKCKQDEPMNLMPFPFSVTRQTDILIPLRACPGSKYAALPHVGSATTVYSSSNRTYMTEVGDFIPFFIARYRPPMLHVCTISRRVVKGV